MHIAVTSGKGGTGKTTVAAALASIAADEGMSAAYVDCDVEEPNGHLFLKPRIRDRADVCRPVPAVDESRCTYCGACAAFCAYNAIACAGQSLMVFPELCHGCGGCRLLCPAQAITETRRKIGCVEIGTAGAIGFVHGILDVGEAMSPPLIRSVKEYAPRAAVTVLDSPPGTSCPVIESVRDCDYAVLVTEPTPFGLSDLKLAVDMVRALGIPHGVVLNRSGGGDGDTRAYLAEWGIDVLAAIPDDRRIAEAYSRGEVITALSEDIRTIFRGLLRAVTKPAVNVNAVRGDGAIP